MSLFDGLKKMGLVQDDMPDYPMRAPEGVYTEPDAPEVEIDTSTVGGQNPQEVIQSVYTQDTFNEDSSIYRMQEFINSLPAEMPTQTKYTTIGCVLNASRIDVYGLIEDAEKRLCLLEAAKNGVQSEHESLCAEANGHIADFMAAIEAAKVKMQDSQAHMTQTCDILQGETERVSKLLDFAKGVVESTTPKAT